MGAGTLGPVFRAHDPAEGRLVAIKVFTLDVPLARAARLVEALDEVVARGMDHPALAAPLAAGLEGDLPWLAQAYVPAESLDRAVAQYGPPPLGDVLTIVTHLAGALDFAAAAGLVHGALHPGDVLVAPDETYLLDVGVAGALRAAGLHAPVHAPYAAPEVVRGGAPSRAADVFALGAVAFELLAGEPAPGVGDAALAGLPEIPGAHRDTLEETFAFALAEPTDERFPTALGFAAALKRALTDAPRDWVGVRRTPAPAVGVLPDLDAPLLVDDAVASSPYDRPLPEVLREIEAPPVEAVIEPEAPGQPPEIGDLVFRAAERPDEAEVSTEASDDAEEARFMDVSGAVDAATAARRFDELPADALDGAAVPARGDDVPAGPAWDDVEPAPRSLPPLRAPEVSRSRTLTDGPGTVASPRRAAPMRTLAATAIAILALLVAVAAGYMWGRRASSPERVEAPGVGTGVAIGGTDDAAAADDTAADASESDTATDLEMPPEPIPEGEPEPPASAPAPSARGEQSASAARPASTPPATRSTPTPTRQPAPAASGQIVVRSTPSGARVEVNGRPSGETPLTLRNLALGAYDIQVTRQGYAAERRRVTLTRGRSSQSVTVPMRRVSGTRGTSQQPETQTSVFVDSRPRGATVYLDGRLVGTTPLQLPEVSVGRHVFRLELKGHRQWTDTVQVVGGERHRVAASLEEETR